MALLSDGSIMLAGAEGNHPFLARLTSGGTLDATFANGGVAITPVPGTAYSGLKSLTVQPDGKLIAAGTATLSGDNLPRFLAMRFQPDGSPDAGFGVNGIRLVDTNPTAATTSVVASAVLQPDGKYVLAGYQRTGTGANENWAVVRLNADGSLDSSFSGDGIVIKDFHGLSDYANDVVLQPDGRILVMGEAFVSGNGYDLAVARYNPDGSADTSFDGDGIIVLPNWTSTIWEQIRAGELNASGQLVFLAGYNSDMRVGLLNLSTDAPPRDRLNVTDHEFLAVSIVPTTVAENAGPAAVTGTVFRSNTDDLSQPLNVAILSTDTTELTVPSTVTIPGGVASVTFPINAIDDLLIDGSQTVTIRASAPGYLELTDSLIVTDNDANVPPVVGNRMETTPEDTALNGQVTGTDADGDALTFSVVSSPLHGQVSMAPGGTWVYVPNANYFGSDTFQYRAWDGRAYSNAGTVTITVAPVNDAPVALDDAFVTDEDQTLTIQSNTQYVTRLQMTSDPGDYIGQGRIYDYTPSTGTFTADASPGSNVVTIRYQSATNGTDWWYLSFASPAFGTPLTVGTYLGATRYPFNPPGTPGLDVTGQHRGSNTLTGFFTVNAISWQATGSLQSFSATFEQHSEGRTPALRGTVQYQVPDPLQGGVLLNDSDVEGSALSAVLVTNPTHGMVSLNPDGTFSYVPDPDFSGVDSFTYVANDGTDNSAPATVSITVNPRPDAPVIQDQSMQVMENSPNGTDVGVVVATDADPEETLSYAIVDGNNGGAFAINSSTGQITVANSAVLDFETTPVFHLTVRVTDNGATPLTSNATVTISLTDVVEPLAVDLDVIPGDSTNTIRRNRKFDVVILSTATFDASQVDVDSLRFGRTGTEDSLARDRRGRRIYSWRDMNGDGRHDLVIRVDGSLTGLNVGDTLAHLTGRLQNGRQIFGQSAVIVR